MRLAGSEHSSYYRVESGGRVVEELFLNIHLELLNWTRKFPNKILSMASPLEISDALGSGMFCFFEFVVHGMT